MSERRRWILKGTPARRPGYPSDLVGATIFLCSAASDFVTGQTLAVDGGYLTGGSWVSEPGDEAALARALAQLTASPALRERIGEANRAKARTEYDEARMIERYRALYDGLIKQR